MKNVIVVGSLNMDLSICCDRMPASGETLNGHSFYINPGGKGGNQAVAAAKLGAPTYMIANVGQDMFGNQLLDTLQNYGVHIEHISKEEHVASGVAMVIRCDGDNRILLGNGANHTLDMNMVKSSIDALANIGDIFLTQLENQYEVVRDAILYAKEKGMYTILNPAPARHLEEQIYEHLDLLIVNQSECELLCGVYPNNEQDCRNALACFENKGVQAIITLGVKGSVVLQDGELIKIASRKVDTVDTTAAGDSYIGALCAQLANGISIKDALVFASDVAAICVTRKGAQVAIPYRQEVLDYYKEESKE